MIYLDDEVEVKWHPNNRNHYEQAGYLFTGYGSTLTVKVRDLPRRSKSAMVRCKCDYCGKDYWTIPVSAFRHEKQCCRNCAILAQRDSLMKHYGVDNPSLSKELREKARNTMIRKYGVPYCAQSKELREKISKTIKERYGTEWFTRKKKPESNIQENMNKRYHVDNAMKVPSIVNKMKNTMEERYGSSSVGKAFQKESSKAKEDKFGTTSMMSVSSIRRKYEDTVQERFGVKTPIQDPIVRMKVMQTNLKKYNAPWYLLSDEFINNQNLHKYKGACSKLQYEIFSRIGGTLEASVNGYRCDIMKNGYDIEIDGGGHWLDVIHGKKSMKEKLKYDRDRDKEIQRLGYKVLRIRCKDSNHLPKDAEAQIFHAMQKQKEYSKLKWK